MVKALIMVMIMVMYMVMVMVNNYPPKWRWLAVDIYRAAERRGKYLTLVTDTEGDNCFSICPVSE